MQARKDLSRMGAASWRRSVWKRARRERAKRGSGREEVHAEARERARMDVLKTPAKVRREPPAERRP
jgi:hypothetical protein